MVFLLEFLRQLKLVGVILELVEDVAGRPLGDAESIGQAASGRVRVASHESIDQLQQLLAANLAENMSLVDIPIGRQN